MVSLSLHFGLETIKLITNYFNNLFEKGNSSFGPNKTFDDSSWALGEPIEDCITFLKRAALHVWTLNVNNFNHPEMD